MSVWSHSSGTLGTRTSSVGPQSGIVFCKKEEHLLLRIGMSLDLLPRHVPPKKGSDSRSFQDPTPSSHPLHLALVLAGSLIRLGFRLIGLYDSLRLAGQWYREVRT